MIQRSTLRVMLTAALIIYLMTLLWNLPAQFVWNRVAGQLPAQVTLHGLTGTLWSGQVQRMEVEGIDQGGLSWDWRPAQIFAGRIAMDLIWQPRNGRVVADLRLGPSSIVLRDVSGQLDAASMAAVNKAPFVLGGSWLLDVPLLALRDYEYVDRAEGRLVWQSAAGGLPQPLQLGHLSADLTGADDWLVFSLSDQGGPLGLQGTARWRPGQPMHINARLQAREGAEAGLVGGLGLIGRPDAQGWIPWQAQLQ